MNKEIETYNKAEIRYIKNGISFIMKRLQNCSKLLQN